MQINLKKSNIFIQIDSKAVNSQHKMLKKKLNIKVSAVRKIIFCLKIRRS